MERKQTGIYGKPDRYNAVDIAYLIEKRGFTWEELRALRMLANASSAIREYIIEYVIDTLESWEGLKPHTGHTASEIAYAAAHNAKEYAISKMGGADPRKLAALLNDPEPWDNEHKGRAFNDYYDRTKSKTPGKLIEAMKDMDPTIRGGNVIDFNQAKAKKRH